MCTATLSNSKVVTSLAYSERAELLASGHPDHIVRLWDARASGDAVVKLKLASHVGWVTGVCWSPTDARQLVRPPPSPARAAAAEYPVR